MEKNREETIDSKKLIDDIQNPVRDLFSSLLTCDKLPTRSEIIKMFKLKWQPINYDNMSEEERIIELIQSPLSRDIVVKEFCYALPCSEAIDLIMKYQPILEIGAGSGFWSALLKKQGCDIISTGLDDELDPFPNKYTEIEQLSAAEAIKSYPNRTVLCSWPREWFDELLPQIDTLIFIGELNGYHEDIDFDCFVFIDQYDMPKWLGLQDNLFVMKKAF